MKLKIDKMRIFIPLGILIAYLGGLLRLGWLWSPIIMLLGYFIIRVPYDLGKYKD